MKKKLSIIIPCFNSSSTLKKTFESATKQGFDSDQFEIIMIDDGSNDNTFDLIKEISSGTTNVKILRNQNNLGGGAARNIAIKHSIGEYIFCLDSDDVLRESELCKMISFMEKNNLDATCFNKCEKFSGQEIDKIIRTDIFGPLNKDLEFPSLVFPYTSTSYPLYINFIYKRNVFDNISGYPEKHGFDTQDFAWKFMSAGFRARICPDSIYTQRVNYKKSYYIREYEAGKVNYNWYEILIDHLYIFNDEIKKYIFNYPLNDPYSNIISDLKEKKDIFRKDLNEVLVSNYKNKLEDYLKSKPSNNKALDNVWLIQRLIKKGNYIEAKKILQFIKESPQNEIINQFIKTCELGLNGMSLKDIIAIIDRDRKYVLRGDRLNFIDKIKRIIKKWLRKYKR